VLVSGVGRRGIEPRTRGLKDVRSTSGPVRLGRSSALTSGFTWPTCPASAAASGWLRGGCSQTVSTTADPAGPANCGGWCAVADHLTLLDRSQEPAGDLVAELDTADQTAQLALEQRFAVVPEWMLDSALSDTAFRLYAILARYGNTSGVRMPGRALLARRLHRSVDTVDRALRELSAAGILTIEHRTQAGRTLTNRYHVRTHDPDVACEQGSTAAAPAHATTQAAAADVAAGGRTGAAPPSRSPAAPRAAPLRPDPEVPTETPPPPTTPDGSANPAEPVRAGAVEEARRPPRRSETGRQAELLVACRITDLGAFTATVQGLRRDAGQPSVRWSAPCLAAAIGFAVTVRGGPARHVRDALLLVAADPRTLSPMRLAEAGPWWDHAERPGLTRTRQEQDELDGLEATLADADDRALLQRTARQQLTAEDEPVTRLTVARRAARLLEQQTRNAVRRPSRGAVLETVLPA